MQFDSKALVKWPLLSPGSDRMGNACYYVEVQ